jgi:hypothetical protein
MMVNSAHIYGFILLAILLAGSQTAEKSTPSNASCCGQTTATASTTTTTPAEETTPFEELTQKFENGQVFHANFSHEYLDSYTGDRSAQSGEMWIGDKEYKIESATQFVAVDGEISRVYDSNRGRLIVSEYVPEEDDFAPSRILNGVDSTYTVVEEGQRADNYFIKLRSDDPFAMFQDVEITLNENDIPVKIFVRDPGDNEITTTFSGGTFINRNAAMFDLSYPDSAEVVDMRN